jgi:general secretion pathway protein K
MRIHTQPDQRAIALIIVMSVIVVLGIIAGGFAYSMKVETTLARNSNFEPDLEWLGRSGVEFARWVLAQQMMSPGEPYDALNQKWAGGPGSMNFTNEALAEISLQNNELGPGRFSVKITDLERKININSADQGMLQQALNMVGIDVSSSATILDSIMDWRDPDDDPHLSGTESDFYLRQDPPYAAKNGPIDDLAELLLIRGITPEVFWGPKLSGGALSMVGAVPRRPALGLIGSEIGPPEVGLVELFTPISARLVNVNTASAQVLKVALGIDDDEAVAGILRIRAGFDGTEGTEDDMPFRNPMEIPLPGFPAQMRSRLASVFTVRSATFEVQVDAEIGNARKRFIAVLRRNNARDIPLMYMYSR